MTPTLEQPLIAALDRRWDEYRLRFKACRQQMSEAAVHDLRVGARRLLAAHDILRTLDSHPCIKRTRRALKKLLANLDGLRDVQVILNKITEAPGPPRVLASFEAQLKKRERRLQGRTRKTMQKSRPSVLRKWIAKTRANAEKRLAQEGVAQGMLDAVDGFYRRAAKLSAQIDIQEPTTLHRARIAFKRFRYASEVVEPLLPTLPGDHFKRMHDHQSNMGDIRDLEIVREALAAFFAKTEATAHDKTTLPLNAVADDYWNREQQLTAAFLAKRDELNDFWRAAPDLPFPWEGA